MSNVFFRNVKAKSSSFKDGQGGSRVLLAVIGTEFDPWKKIFLEGQRKTWLNMDSENYQIIYVTCRFYGAIIQKLGKTIEFLRWNAGRTISYALAYSLMITLFVLRGKVPKLNFVEQLSLNSSHKISSMQINCPESLTSLRWKKITVVKYFLQTDCDYLLFINPSTYVSISNLEKFLKSSRCNQEKFLYAGQVAHSADSPFIIGSFTLMNRGSAQLLLSGRWKIATHTLDDVAFGKFFSDCNVKEFGIPSTTIDDGELLHNSGIRDIINFRIKIESENRASEEIKIMKKLYDNLGVR